MKLRLPAFIRPLLAHLSMKIWLLLGGTLLVGVALTATALKFEQQQLSRLQLQQLASVLAEQTSRSVAPLLLANDELSLSITLSQLTELDAIQGAEVIDRNGNPLTQTGKQAELTLERPIRVEQTELGKLRLHLDPEQATYQFGHLLPLTLAALLLSLTLLLVAIWLLTRHLRTPLHALLEASQQLDQLATSPLDAARADELGQIASNLNARFAPPEVTAEVADSEKTIPAEQSAPDESASEYTDRSGVALADQPSTAAFASAEVESAGSPQQPNSPVYQANKTAVMAADTPSASDLNRALATAGETSGGKPDNTEQQDAAVTLHENAPQGYLLYINHHVGGSDTLTSTEREQLLVRYYRSLEQVARLYKGQLSEDALGNWCVRFTPLSEDQSHGINALCAAQLFNALYRGINTQAIRNFSPALNMKLVLLCGPIGQFNALAEDALLLSDQIQENDLITHQTLYQTPVIKERLLGRGQFRKYDDDTYLIASLNSDYQTLIDRQAEHFLKQA